MRHIFLFVLVFCLAQSSQSQSIFWSENFNHVAATCDPSDAAFIWNVTDIGAQGSDANYWYIDTTVNCSTTNVCYSKDTSSINKALFISYGNICDTASRYGPVYRKGCDNTTDKRVESPTIDCSGKTHIRLDFDYLASHAFRNDHASLLYSSNNGSTWSTLDTLLNSGHCPTVGALIGFWQHYSISLPTSANNNATVKIAFAWVNNDDCYGTFASVAIDNLALSIPCISWSVSDDSLCPASDCPNFLLTVSGVDSVHWYFPGGTPSYSTSGSPTICYFTPGDYNVAIAVFDSACSDSIIITNCIHVFPFPPPQGILQSGDTLFANTGAYSYQWYENGILISGATNYYYVVTASDNYSVVADDIHGCEVEAAIFDVICTCH